MKITKEIKIGIIAIISVGIIFGLYKLNDYLSKEKRWFYGTATDLKAFDKLYWGMSKIEVERTLGIKIKQQLKLLLPNVRINQTTSDFNKEYYNINGWSYNREIDNQLLNFEIGRGTNIYGIDSYSYNLEFYNNKLFKIIIEGLYLTNDTTINKDLYIKNIRNDLTRKYGKPSILDVNHLQFNNSNVSADFYFEQLNYKPENKLDLTGTSFESSNERTIKKKKLRNNFIGLNLKYKPIVELIKNDLKEIESNKF